MKRLFNLLLLGAVFLLLPSAATAQGGGGGGGGGRRLEKIENARIAFLTNRLNLTTDQAQKFWPLYNEYDGKRREIRKRSVGKARELETLADAQLQGAVNDMLAARQDELNLDKEYIGKFQKVISLRQTVVLYRSEREFTKFLLKKLQERRGERMGGGTPAGVPDELGDD